MASTYVRRFNLKDSLSDQQVASFWKFLLGEFTPAIQKVAGVNACKVYSGAGALRADIRLVADMDNAGVYEGLLRDPTISPMLGTSIRKLAQWSPNADDGHRLNPKRAHERLDDGGGRFSSVGADPAE